ncbi:hypothetical protein EYR38_009959 [Pleurotus pulmonarius]|nr:hypothetical protein EYR38_009959 [Pleurotus pulmonarius]
MSNKPPLNRDVAGDYYAGDQVGANVGGHNNTNHVFNGREEDFKTQLTRIKAIYNAQKQSMQQGDYYATLGQVHTMKVSLDKLLAEVNAFNDKVQADFDNKFRGYIL